MDFPACPNCGAKAQPTDTHCMDCGAEIVRKHPQRTAVRPRSEADSAAVDAPFKSDQSTRPPDIPCPRCGGQLARLQLNEVTFAELISLQPWMRCTDCGHRPASACFHRRHGSPAPYVGLGVCPHCSSADLVEFRSTDNFSAKVLCCLLDLAFTAIGAVIGLSIAGLLGAGIGAFAGLTVPGLLIQLLASRHRRCRSCGHQWAV